MCLLCFFKQKTAYEMRISYLCSYVCSSVLGHYALPIVSGGEVSGVLVLYLPVGHRAEQEITHLRAVADVLAGMIVRKRAEAAAEQSRSRLVEAQRIARVGSWENDLRSRVSVWSDEQFHILGYRPGEIEPHIDIFLARVHPDDAGRVLNALAAAERSERFAVEHRVVHSEDRKSKRLNSSP